MPPGSRARVTENSQSHRNIEQLPVLHVGSDLWKMHSVSAHSVLAPTGTRVETSTVWKEDRGLAKGHLLSVIS